MRCAEGAGTLSEMNKALRMYEERKQAALWEKATDSSSQKA